MQMRLSLINHEPSRQVLAAVAELSGWRKPLEKGRGRCVAFHFSFGVPVAEVVEVTQTPNGIRIDRVCVAADVGTALDPRNIEAQLQGAVIFGLSAAMFGEITFANGAVEKKNFHEFESVRMHQAPRIEVRVLQTGGPIRGIGEPGTPHYSGYLDIESGQGKIHLHYWLTTSQSATPEKDPVVLVSLTAKW